MEVDHVEHRLHVDALQVEHERVALERGCHAVDDDVFIVVVQRKLVDHQPLVAVDDVAGLELPCCSAQMDGRGHESDVRFALSVVVLIGLRDSIDGAAV